MTNWPANSRPKRHSQVRLLTRHFHDLQGLQQVPFGVLFLVLFVLAAWLPATPQEFPQHGPAYTRLLVAAALAIGLGWVVAFVAMKLIRARYIRDFGTVEPPLRHRVSVYMVTSIAPFLLLYPINSDKQIWLATGKAMPVNTADFVLAAGLLIYWWYLGRSQYHYLVLAGFGIALGLVSALGLTPATWLWHVRETLLYFGVATIAGGVLDHLALARALPASAEAS